jgi:hypothetical protein
VICHAQRGQSRAPRLGRASPCPGEHTQAGYRQRDEVNEPEGNEEKLRDRDQHY